MAWWLAYEELFGDMDKEYPIMSKDFDKDVTILGGSGEDTLHFNLSSSSQSAEYITFTGMESAVGGADTVAFDFRTDGYPGSVFSDTLFESGPDTIKFGVDTTELTATVVGGIGNDHISFMPDGTYEYASKPQPDLKYKSQKYQEDKGIADLKDYVSSTYQGHYTNDSSDVQTLDLIHSVGDAESFCRSNALKYLSRYDKKGSAKRDILKAMHYCLLLYYFSGNTNNETPTYGYETF